MKAPINARKHYVQHTITQVGTGTVTTLTEINAVAHLSVDAPNEVEEGSIIKAVFCEIWLIGTFNLGSFLCMVEKNIGATGPPSFTEMSTLDSYNNKKNILFTSQGLMSEDGANPTPVLRQWIKIPRGKQRFGLGDQFRICLASLSGEDLQFCGFVTYKDYR